SLGDYTGAAKAAAEAHQTLRRLQHFSPEARALLAANISQIGVLAVATGDTRFGIAQQRRALRLRRRHLPHGDLAIAESLGHLAAAHLAQGHYRRARRYSRRALALYGRGPAADRVYHASQQLMYGYAGFKLGRRSAATEISQAIGQARDLLGDNHHIVSSALAELARLRAAEGHPDEGLRLLAPAADTENHPIGPVFGGCPEPQRLQFLAGLSYVRDQAVSLTARGQATGPGQLATVFRIVAQRSGLTLDMTARLRRTVRSGSHPPLTADLDRLQQLDGLLGRLALDGSPPVPLRTIRHWEQERDRLEVRLTEQTKELTISRELLDFTLERLAAALAPGSVLVTYVRFNYTKHPRDGGDTAHPRYGAFAVAAGDPGGIKFADLGAADPVDRLITSYREQVAPAAGRGVQMRAGARTASEWTTTAAALYQTVWAPLEGALAGRSRLLVVADGQLHRLPLATLIGPSGNPLIANTVLTYLGSPRDALTAHRTAPAGPPVVIADPDFGAIDRRLRRSRPMPVFKPLPGSAAEGRDVAALLGTPVLAGQAARKAALTVRPPPGLIHIVTHGFWLGDAGQQEEAATVASRSGLALAGANRPGNEGIL
ncbi:MAG: CHAT domain-containing protein, partial [Streptosporangiaceae bacterium]